jgi:hypothetical protein
MGDAKQILVNTEIEEAGAAAAGQKVIAWLKKRGFIGPPELEPQFEGNPFTGPIKRIADKEVWPPGPNVLSAVQSPGKEFRDFRERDPNHLELRTGRAIYAQDSATCSCPACGEQIPAYWDLAQAWIESGGDRVTCPACGKAFPVKELRFDPPGAPGALAVVMWNWWPLRPAIVDQLSKEVGGQFVLVWDFL